MYLFVSKNYYLSIQSLTLLMWFFQIYTDINQWRSCMIEKTLTLQTRTAGTCWILSVERKLTVGFLWLDSCSGYSLWFGFEITVRHSTLGRTLWTINRPVAETATWQHITFSTDRHPCPPVGFEPAITASDRPPTPRHRPRGYRDRR